MSGAIILGGDCGALATARSLGRRGIPVIFLSGSNRLASFSRHVRQTLKWPGPEAPGAVDWLLDLASREGFEGWTLLPAADADVRLVSQNHERLSTVFKLGVARWETVKWAADKAKSYQLAERIGVDFPRTFEASLETLRKSDARFPLILKPARKSGKNALTDAKAWQVDTMERLEAVFDEAVTMSGVGGLIVQEMVPGDGSMQFSYAGVYRDGKPIVSMVARRTRQHPANFGTGCFVETIEDGEIERLAEQFLAAFDFSGMVEMEFKQDERSRAFKLLDVNPRIWTWTALGDAAGIDFPFALWTLANGQSPERKRARPGAAWMYVSRDLPEAMREIWSGKLALKDYMRSLLRHPTLAVFTLEDPLPSLMDLPASFSRRKA
jgi:D-aspartate ligase